MKIYKTLLTISFLLASLFLFSCETATDDDLGEFYEGSFKEQVVFNLTQDSSFIILEQKGVLSVIKEDVPFAIVNDQSLKDSIKLKMFVSYGSYNQFIKPIKEIHLEKDSVFLWYSTRNKFNKALSKSNNITGIKTSPRLEYVSVDSVVIYKSESKYIEFFARVIR